MSYTTFHQYDSRWSDLNYNGSSTMGVAGCGPTSCATVISNHNPKIDPKKTMKYMQDHGYAIRDHGTAWDGIPACMKWGGLTNVKELTTMNDLWDFMKKKHSCGVLLFKAGTVGGITWTLDGHFVAFTAMKIVDGKHYLWTRDPGGRNHTGWYCYETQMKGLIRKIWVGTSEPPKTKQEKKLEKIKKMAVKCSWPKGTPRSIMGYPEGHAKKAYKKALNAALPNRSGWRDQTKKGSSCDVFAAVAARASGVDKKFPRCCDDIIPYTHTDHCKKIWTVKTPKGRLKAKDIPNGAIIYQKYKSGAQHIMVKVNNKTIANAHYCKKTYPIREKYSDCMRQPKNCQVTKIFIPK